MPKPPPLDVDPIEEIEEELLAGRGRRRRKPRDVDYVAALKAVVIDPMQQCPHTLRAVSRGGCSQCMGAIPSIVSGETVPVIEDDWEYEDES